jgi:hypothetical protein
VSPPFEDTQKVNESLLSSNNSLPHTITSESPGKHDFTDQLGFLLAEFKKKPLKSTDQRLLIGIAGLTILVIFYSAIRYFYALTLYGSAAAIAWSRWSFGLAIFLIILFLAIFVLAKVNQKVVYLHRNGIALCQAGRKPRLFLWRQLAGISYLQEEITVLMLRGIRLNAKLYPNQGKPISLSSYSPNEHLPELVTQIKARLYPILEPELKNMAIQGQTLYFGGLSISRTGIRINNQVFEWEKIGRINISDGVITLFPEETTQSRRNTGLKISLQKIYNPELLFILIDKLTNNSYSLK